MKKHFLKSWIPALALGLAAIPFMVARADSITASVDSAEMAVGQPGQLTVTVTGSQTQPSIPNVPGLEITPTGQSTQIEIINGAMTANASDTYDVTPERAGTFVIPAIQAGNASSQPITLHVVDNGGTPSPALPAPGQMAGPSLPAPAVAAPSPDDSSPVEGRFGSIRMNVPKENFYVGQLVPIEIKAFVPDGLNATITDLPQFTSDGIILNSLSTKPDQTSQIINGQPYTVMTWHSALTAVKSGTYLVSLKMPESVVEARSLSPMNSDDNDDFNNFFKNAFAAMGTMGTKKEVVLQSETEAVKVLPLPLAGRPADFSGAVGQFSIEASASPTQVATGDPITLQMKISGRGNFDRVSSQLLGSNADWKTYGVKSHFEAADSDGFQGAKTFEQPIVPNSASVTKISPLSFSFFDPELHGYVTRTSDSIPVSVSGPALASNPDSNAPARAASQPVTTSSPSDLRPNQVDIGMTVSTLRPVFLQTWFLAGQSLPVLALLAGMFFIRRREQRAAPNQLRASAAQRAIRQHIAAMDEAIRHGEAESFFIHARSALQECLGKKWNLRPETITLAEIDAHGMTDDGVVRPVFEMADQASYSDLQVAQTDLSQWRRAVASELQTAERN
jgi:hypothetical protein